MRRGRKLGMAVGLMAVVAAGGGGWFFAAGAGHGPTIIYDAVPVGRGLIRRTVSTSGPVRALVTVSVGSQITGMIARVEVDYNAEVKAGQLLAVFDSKSHVAAANQARADLAMAKASLANQESTLRKAEAVLRETELRAARVQALAAKGIAATKSLDDMNRDADVAKAEVDLARSQIESAKAGIAMRESALEQALITLARTEIRSPVDGTVILRAIEAGQTMSASMSTPELFKIAQDLSRIRIEAQVNEADVGAIAAGNPVTFTVDAFPTRRFSGRVAQVRLASSDAQNVVTYTVIIEAGNEGRRLLPGMTANVLIETVRRADVLRLPNDALRFKLRNGALALVTAQGFEGRFDELASELKAMVGMSEAQIAKVREQLAASGDGAEILGGTQPNPRLDARLERAVAGAMTPEQEGAVQAWLKGRESVRRAVVHLLDAAGEPKARQIKIAVADETHAEVVSGLEVGDRVIVRAREAR